MRNAYDLIVVGSGIVGLSVALAAAEKRWRVLIVDREARPVGASIRNFGFVTVTGQRAGLTWARARRTAERWAEICEPAGILILQRGLMLAAHEPLSGSVLDAFLDSPMGHGLEPLDADEACRRVPALRRDGLIRAVYSPHELRIEPRTAVPALARWLHGRREISFLPETVVHEVTENVAVTSRGTLRADRIAVCPGPDLRTLFPDTFARHGTTLCKLQMMRVRSAAAGLLTHPVMGDLSLVRYAGYAELAESGALRRHLETSAKDALDHGVHIIVVQSADGSWVIGDSHHYEPSPDPFHDDSIDRLILEHTARLVDLSDAQVLERWVGVYPSAQQDAFIESPCPGVRVVSVTSGTGMSTGLALGEEAVAGWE
jgi:FAD dependent oxidoreductase TIGR03364